jgi:hypothetical protein
MNYVGHSRWAQRQVIKRSKWVSRSEFMTWMISHDMEDSTCVHVFKYRLRECLAFVTQIHARSKYILYVITPSHRMKHIKERTDICPLSSV